MPDLVMVKNAARLAVYVATNIVPVIHHTAATTLPKVDIIDYENDIIDDVSPLPLSTQ